MARKGRYDISYLPLGFMECLSVQGLQNRENGSGEVDLLRQTLASLRGHGFHKSEFFKQRDTVHLAMQNADC